MRLNEKLEKLQNDRMKNWAEGLKMAENLCKPVSVVVSNSTQTRTKDIVPLSFKKTNIKESIIDKLNKNSLERSVEEKIINDRFRQKFKDCVSETSEIEEKIKKILDNRLRNYKIKDDENEEVRLRQAFRNKQKFMIERKNTLKNEYFEKISEQFICRIDRLNSQDTFSDYR